MTMGACDRVRKVSAYHDGELGAEEARLMEAHLAECPVCAGELRTLRALSGVLSRAVPLEAPEPVMARLYATASDVRERVVIRLAERLMAAAAAVLVACGVLLWTSGRTSANAELQAAAWERAAVTLHVEAAPTGEDQQLAQWIVQDLSKETGND